MSESLPIHCHHRKKHNGKGKGRGRAPVLGIVTPRENYGRLFVQCREEGCEKWWPAPPPYDPTLAEVRCFRAGTYERDPANDLRLRSGKYADFQGGEVLALVDLKLGAKLEMDCSRHGGAVRMTVIGIPGGHSIEAKPKNMAKAVAPFFSRDGELDLMDPPATDSGGYVL